MLVASLVASSPALAQVLPDGAACQVISFDLMDGKPMLPVVVNGTPGWMMFDNGTPDLAFFNREAAPLSPGVAAGKGHAASGQEILIEVTEPPVLTVGDRPVPLQPKVITGNFGFTRPAFGDAFMGFLGTPFVQDHAFILDYDQKQMTILRTAADGTLTKAAPDQADILAEVHFALWPGEQPTIAALLDDLPILLDVDTGDAGTAYLRPETQQRLITSGAIRRNGDGIILSRLKFGGIAFSDVALELVTAGGPEDHRSTGQSDWLRLGSNFLSVQPVLWSFPGRTLTLLRRESLSGWRCQT